MRPARRRTLRGTGFRCRVASLLLAGLLAGCAPLLVPTHDPQPFPEGLRKNLREPWMDRAAVHDRLGPPTTTRRDGQLEIYVAQRLDTVAYPSFGASKNYEYHYLLLSYDADRIGLFRILLQAGCLPGGICLNDASCRDQPDCPKWKNTRQQKAVLGESAAELLRQRIDEFTVHASPEETRRTLEDAAATGACKLLLDRDEGPPRISIALDASSAYNLPEDGFLAWRPLPGSHSMAVTWTDWRGRRQATTTTVECREGETLVYHVELAKTRYWGWQYALQVRPVAPENDLGGIGRKVLILQ